MMDMIIALMHLISVCILSITAYLMYNTYRADHERRSKQATIEYINSIRPQYKEINCKGADILT